MPKRLFAALSLACLTTGNLLGDEALAPKPDKVENITIVLDCSATMSQPLSTDEHKQPGQSRLAASRGAVLQLLSELSASESHRVTLCLFGHRLTSAGVPREQREYLERFASVRQMEGLLASEDVELVRSGELLEPKHLDDLKARLELVKPWGDNPLYLSVCRVADLQPASSDLESRRIILITDGIGEAEDAAASVGLEDALQSLKEHSVPLDVVKLGRASKQDSESAARLEQLARTSGGQIRQVGTPAELKDALRQSIARQESFVDALAQIQAPLDGIAPDGTALDGIAPDGIAPGGIAPGGVAPGGVTPVVVVPELPADDGFKVRVSIKYYKENVRGAKVVLKSVNGDTDTARYYKELGIYEFSDLQEAEYVLEVTATIHNRVFQTARPVVVDGIPDAPLMFLINFE